MNYGSLFGLLICLMLQQMIYQYWLYYFMIQLLFKNYMDDVAFHNHLYHFNVNILFV